MRLDVNTPAGQESLRHEKQQLLILKKNHPDVEFIHTPKDMPSDVDGFVVQDGTAVAMFLSSCRDMTKHDLEQWDNEWLLTNDKIIKATQLAKQLCMPVAGYLYLIPEGSVLVVRLINNKGEVLPSMRVERTMTQATCNGGKALRSNAYINISGARELT